MKILMVSPYVPWPIYGGTSVRIFNLLRELSGRGHEIILLAGSKDKNPKIMPDNPLKSVCKEVRFFELDNRGSFGSAVRSLFSLQPYPVLNFYTDSLKRSFSNALSLQKFDLIWVNLSVLGNILFDGAVGNTSVLLDHPECEELVYEDYLHEGGLKEKIFSVINLIKLKRFHKKIFSKVDVILCVSEEEAKFTRKQTNKKVWVVPNGVDEKKYYPADISKNNRNYIILSGGMNIRRNIDSAVWFVSSIFTKIKEQINDAELWIVGSDPVAEVKNLGLAPGVRVTGTVENIGDYYRMGKVFVAPYRFGAGTKLKVFEAMASGIPIVSTSVGCRGIKVIDKEHLIIANNEKDFSNSVIGLLNNPELSQRLSRNSLALIKKEYRWENIVDKLEPILMNLKNNKK
ncbi:MAG: glycosyltransferase family 4 protein [Candidatus Staskawiczbacteria bacterium]|nr:glycosyltransferase family 4 protein [Candidatus Staskawiczbacteria bacterium]